MNNLSNPFLLILIEVTANSFHPSNEPANMNNFLRLPAAKLLSPTDTLEAGVVVVRTQTL